MYIVPKKSPFSICIILSIYLYRTIDNPAFWAYTKGNKKNIGGQ